MEGHTWFVLDVTLTMDGRRALTCSLDRSIKVWDLESNGKQLYEISEESSEAVNQLSVSNSGRFLLTNTEKGEITLYDLYYMDAMRVLALCSAGHQRLGKLSAARKTPDVVFQRIALFLHD